MLDSARKADEVAEDLLRRIVSGEIAVGTLLPREADLAQEYGVGRSVVREAGKLLEVHRLVRPRRRRGTEVLDPLESATPAVIGAMLVDEAGELDGSMLEELLEVRTLIDVRMSALAARHRTDDDLSALRECVQRIEQSAPDSAELRTAVDDLGLAVARASKNRIFVMLAHWHRQITGELPVLMHVRRAAARVRGHQLLLAAIENKDAELAAALVREFHDWANRHILANVSGDLADQTGDPSCST